MNRLDLGLHGLRHRNPGGGDEPAYGLAALRERAWDWDQVTRGTHHANCWYARACALNIYQKDGVVLREEQAGVYPPFNDPDVPDFNPRGCQKGLCYAHQMYHPGRVRFPLKRAGARGDGQWQRVTWDQALTEISDAFLDVLASEGNDAILRLSGTQAGASAMTGLYNLDNLLGLPFANITVDDGDEAPGAALTWGKVAIASSLDNWFYADLLLVWGCNPGFTQIANFHFMSEARYHGTKVIAITPDYNASAPFADLWVPIRTGTDAALALAMAQVIISRKLYQADFVREQTDLPLLVRIDSHKFLTQKDMLRGGRDNIFYVFDEASGRVVTAPWKTLALDGIVPALEGEYEVDTLQGKVKVRPVFDLLKEHLKDYTPEAAGQVTGVSPRLIEQLAVEFASARAISDVTSAGWGKHYHGDLVQRAQILLWALCGQFGRKGAGYNPYPMLMTDTGVASLQRRGAEALLSAESGDPRFAQWRQDGYTDEMIQHEYMTQAMAQGNQFNMALLFYFHGGMADINEKHSRWDPYLKRPVSDYVNEALARGWQYAIPGPEKPPSIVIEGGGSFVRRCRATNTLIENLLPKLKLLITLDPRLGATAMYSDFVLPVAGYYEKHCIAVGVQNVPYVHLQNKVVEPLGEAKSEWEIACLLAAKLQERALARGILSFKDRNGRERRLDNLYDQMTTHGLYTDDDEEAVTRDYFLNAANLEKMEWEDFKEKGFAAFTAVGRFMPDSACDITPGEPLVPLTYHVHDRQIYPTYTRRMQFYIDHDWFLELGEAFPTHKEIPAMGGDYPLQLTSGHARWSIHSLWTDAPLTLRLQRGEPVIFMSAEDARSRGIRDGDYVEAFNDVASCRLLAHVTPAVRPGQAVIYHGWENFQFAGKRHCKSLAPSPINPIELAGGYYHIRPRSGYHAQPGASDRGTRVDVRRTD
ncbi:MAG: molybdopterin-dependent oxidoreductase [Chloroflexi bacterium]|nr:molybdopterin-dependent oxidoreductase [Chloroflexota bacterium]